MHDQFIALIKTLLNRTESQTRALEDLEFYSEQQKIHQICPQYEHELFFNIKNTAQRYSLLKTVIKRCIEYLINEQNAATAQMLSGQCTPQECEELKNQVNKFEELEENLHRKLSFVSKQSSNHIKNRSFLPLVALEFKYHEQCASKFESNLYFLGSDYTNIPNIHKKFRRFIFDKSEYAVFEKSYLGSATPQELIKNSHEFLNISSELNIAICQYEARHTGFIIYSDKNNAKLNAELHNYAQRFPNSLSFLEEDSIWVLQLFDEGIMESDFLNLFDVWLDSEHCVYYINESLFPIMPSQDLNIRLDNNADYLHGIFFDHIDKIEQIRINEIIFSLQTINPFENPKEIKVYHLNGFEKPNQKEFWTFSSSLLISYKVNESTEKLALYNTQQKTITFVVETTDYFAKYIEELFKTNLKLLRINGFENINYSKLV